MAIFGQGICLELFLGQITQVLSAASISAVHGMAQFMRRQLR